jgi:hypothetical protein
MTGLGTVTLLDRSATSGTRPRPSRRGHRIEAYPIAQYGIHEAPRPALRRRLGHPLARKFWAVLLRLFPTDRPRRLPCFYL